MSGTYTFHKYLAEGGQSAVYLAERNVDKEKVVVVCSTMSLETRIYGHEMTREIPGFCQLYEHFKGNELPQKVDWACVSQFPSLIKKDNHFCILEYVGNQNIEQFCLTLRFKERIIILQKLIYTIAQLHAKNLYHLDLKPDNVLMKGNIPVIIDLGSMQEGIPFKKPYYSTLVRDSFREVMPAERTPMFSPMTDCITDGARFDIYSLGCIMYCCLIGNEDKSSYFEGKFDLFCSQAQLIHDHFGDNLMDLLSKMLNAEQCYRPTVSEVLQHPFFNPQFKLIRYNYIKQLELREVFIRNNKKQLLEHQKILLRESSFEFIQSPYAPQAKLDRTVKDDCLPVKYRRYNLQTNYFQSKQPDALKRLFDETYLIDKSEIAQLVYLNHQTMLNNITLHLQFPELKAQLSITPQMMVEIQRNFLQFQGSDESQSEELQVEVASKNEPVPPPRIMDLSLMADLDDLPFAPPAPVCAPAPLPGLFAGLMDDDDGLDIFGLGPGGNAMAEAQAPLVMEYGSSSEEEIQLPQENGNTLQQLLGGPEETQGGGGFGKFKFGGNFTGLQ